MRCPVCNFENAETAKFCSNCGNRMPERRTMGTSERRVVTVLFCDVKGSTTFAEKMDPEEWTEIISGAFTVLTPPIQRYGGTVARLLGDAVLAFFGAPVAHEDDPERAVRAGLEMLHATDAYRDQLVRERGAAFSGFDIRIGINTGLAVVGDVGSGQAVEYTGMGDAVNVAARLQSLAAPGTMLVSEHTLRRLPPIFEWEPAGDAGADGADGTLALKGREGRVGAFRVTGVSAAARARAPGLVTPLVGRTKELAALRDALAETRHGSGRIVSIVGDAGLGKTRLIDELRKEWVAAAEEGQRWSEARGQSYEQTRSYGLFRQHLLGLAGTSDADPPEVIRARVAALLPERERADERALRTLEVFLAVDRAGGGVAVPEGEELRAEVRRLVHDLVLPLASARSVLVFDDLQWSDPASAELLMELVEIVEEAPLLVICAFRPDRQAPSWNIKQRLETDLPHRYDELVLPPLTMSESAELLAHALPQGSDALPVRLSGRILDKAEGNPFFLEEIVRALLDDGTIAREGETWSVTRPDAEIRLPESLQAVLAARIDRLEAESRETLQAAAVIGRTFLYKILAAIREASDKLDGQLRSLQRLELVQERSREPEREYTFRHALTQEAAYGSILQRKRRELHLRVGETLESLFPDRAEELAPVLGHHYAEAADPRAVRHLKSAGDRALRLHALEEATSHYRRTLALVRRDDPDATLVRELYLRYGRALELRGDYATALELYQELERIAQERGDRAMEVQALSAQATIHSNPTPFIDTGRAAELIERSIGVARDLGDEHLVARLLWNRCQVGFWKGDPDAGVGPGLESAEVARRIGDTEQLAFTLNSLGQAYREMNQLDRAAEVLDESIALFRGLGNRPMEADGLSTRAFIHIYRGELEAARASGDEAYRIGVEIGNEWAQAYGSFTPGYVEYEVGEWGRAIERWEGMVVHAERAGFFSARAGPGADLGYLYALAGDDERSVKVLEGVVELAREKFKDWRGWSLAQLGRVLVMRGDLARAREVLAEAAAHDRPRGNLYMSVFIALGRGELALAEGRPADARAIGRDDRRRATERGLRPFEKDFDLIEGEALRAAGDVDAARAALTRVIEASRAIGSRCLLWRSHGALAAIAETRGEIADARREREAATAAVDHIARSLRGRGLEERFRMRAAVREALGLSGRPA